MNVVVVDCILMSSMMSSVVNELRCHADPQTTLLQYACCYTLMQFNDIFIVETSKELLFAISKTRKCEGFSL